MSKLKSTLAFVLCFTITLVLIMPYAYAQQGDPLAPRRISVCINGDPTESRGFCWYTGELTDSRVEVYTDPLLAGTPILYKASAPVLWEGSYMHKVLASGLEAGKKYYYRVGNGSVWSDKGEFCTDDGDDAFSFITIADIQASSLENFQKGAQTLKAAYDTMPAAEFVINCGDFTNDSTNEEWDYYDQALSELNRMSTLAPVSGNHDGLGVENWFNNMFNLDTSQSVQTSDGVNYSFDYGNAHFAVVNTNDILSISNAQLDWLRNDLNSTDKDWKIVAMHKSPYSLGKDAKWPDALYLQQSLAGVMDECNVDVVFSGHDHMYLRTKAITGNELAEDGTTYVLAGTAGTKRYEVRSFLADSFMKTEFIDALVVQKNGYGNYWNGTDWNSTSQNNVGGCFSCISISGGTLTLNAYIIADEKDAQGNDVITNIDTLTLTKETGLNVPTYDGDNTISSADYYLQTVSSFVNLATYTIREWLPIFILLLPEILVVYFKDGTF